MILKSMKRSHLIIAVLFAAALGMGVFVWQNQAGRQVVREQSGEEIGASIDEQKQFVVDVDPDVSHWQTKETESFKVKFPKEWYWVEFPGYDNQGSGSSFVVSNNPAFPLAEYSNKGIFPDRSYELILKNSTEIVVDFDIYDYGARTSSSGNPQDPQSELNRFLRLVPRINSTAICEPLFDTFDMRLGMVSASCSIKQEHHQKNFVFYKATRAFSLMVTMKTVDTALVDSSILRNIAESFVMKN